MTSASQFRGRLDRLDTGRSPTPPAGGLRLDERVSSLRERLDARADSRAAAAVRNDAREARGHVRDWSPGRVSPSTAERYERAVELMRSRGQRPEDAKCRASFEFRRAAVVHEARSELKGALRDLDRARRSGDLERAADAYLRVQGGLATLRRYPPSTGSREGDLERQSAFRGPSRPDQDQSNGKRQSLDQLPADWRDDVQRAARPEDRPALAALGLSGCRPAEVKGIKVRQTDEHITVEIRGAKCDADRGIKTRTLEFDKAELSQSQAGRDLTEWLGNRECRTISHAGSVEAFRERVSRACDRAGHEQASAYSFRHAEARTLKESGAGRNEIARRLGHRSDRSQSVYG